MNSLFGNWASTLRRFLLWLVLSTLLPIFGISNSVRAAERIYASYSALERSIPVNALEVYAENGVIDDHLAIYTQYLKPAQVQDLRRLLVTPIKVNAVAVSQFLYTPQGEFLLQRLAQVIKTESRQKEAGIHALRSALILAGNEPQGLTLLNVLRKYPNSAIHIDLARSLGIAGELEKLVEDTDKALSTVSQKSNIEATSVRASFNSSLSANLRLKGHLKVQKLTLKLFDTVRGRFLLTDVYLPNVQNPVPVIVISHGLGSDSSNFEYLAANLASHGYGVVVPNHPGSDTKEFQALLNGSASDVTAPEEFYNRPLDVKYVLDQLEERNKSEFQGRLNLRQVGVVGQSLGGYTALALAGAKINFEQLAKDCTPEALKDTWNMSLLLQCRALKLRGTKEYDLHDERVKAVIAVNPITSSIFGKVGLQQIHVPVMFVASSDDTVAPALYEQILPFSWINNPQKYLVLLSGATHFSTIGNGNSNQQIGLSAEIAGDDPAQARIYMNALSLLFFQAYVVGMPKYATYLNAGYAKAISNPTMGLSLIQSLTTSELAQAFK